MGRVDDRSSTLRLRTANGRFLAIQGTKPLQRFSGWSEDFPIRSHNDAQMLAQGYHLPELPMGPAK